MFFEEWAAFGYENFNLSIIEIDTQFPVLDHGAVRRVENIADNLSLVKSGIRYILMDLPVNLIS